MSKTSKITQIAILAAIAFIISLLKIPLWFAPWFYRFDFSEVIILISGFSLGPISGMLVEFVKIIIKLIVKGTMSFGIGELSDFLIGCSFVLPSAYFYKIKKSKNIHSDKRKGMKFACISLCIGTISTCAVSLILNAFIILPSYCTILHVDMQNIISSAHTLNSWVNDEWSFIFFTILPFNLIKGTVSSIFCFVLYKKVKPIIEKFHFNINTPR